MSLSIFIPRSADKRFTFKQSQKNPPGFLYSLQTFFQFEFLAGLISFSVLFLGNQPRDMAL